jgi:phosphatidylserine decarboxylase
MLEINYIDRETRREKIEKIYGKFFIQMLYGSALLSRLFSFFLRPLFSRISFFSRFYGTLQKSAWSRRKIKPFVQDYQIDASEFLEPIESFRSFNDFFIRKLKPSCRPIANGSDVATLPADGRYLVFANIDRHEGFLIKGEKFSLDKLLLTPALAAKYTQGSMAVARLCPTDYHRFHFPCTCVPEKPHLINGPLFSVNPLALKHNIHILSENKRVITALQTKNFGTLLYIEVGATYVGSITQTFISGEPYVKGDEKGYFSFGGSCIILLFEPGRIEFDQDLLEASQRKIEMRGLYGQSLGRSLRSL